MGLKLCLLFLSAVVVGEVRCQSFEELAKMAGIDLKDLGADAFEKHASGSSSSSPSSLAGRLFGGSGFPFGSSPFSTSTPTMKSAASSPTSAESDLGSGASPCGHCGNCPSCIAKHMRMMNPDFGGFAAGTEGGYPGMMGQMGPIGLGSDVEAMNGMPSSFGSPGGLQSQFGGYGAGASNFLPTSYAPFMGAQSMMAGAGMGEYEQFPETSPMTSYPQHDEEMPRPYPLNRRPTAPATEAVQYEPVQQGQGGDEEGPSEEQGPPAYDQGLPEQDQPQGYTGSQGSGRDRQKQHEGYGRQQESEGQGYQQRPQSRQREVHQKSDSHRYGKSKSYYDK